MKRFLFSMAVAITFITIGFTSLFFEFRNYEIVALEDMDELTVRTVAVDDVVHNDKVIIDVEDSYLYIDIRDDLKTDDEIKIEYPVNVELDIRSSRIKVEGDYGYGHSYSYSKVKDMVEVFMEGLKHRKIYTNIGYGGSNQIIVHCSPAMRSKIKVNYD